MSKNEKIKEQIGWLKVGGFWKMEWTAIVVAFSYTVYEIDNHPTR